MFKRETRYLVLKGTDMNGCLTNAELEILGIITEKVRIYREESRSKLPLQCVVVESDWPEYEPVWKMIEERMENEPERSR